MLGNLFKQQSHYVYNYKPRYYNPRKERIEKLQKDYKGEQSAGLLIEKNTLKGQWSRKKKSSANKNVNIRLAIIITILVTITFFILDLDQFL